ncbi:hypothetical protein FB451DRAFT_1376746 [Mycena latifolia]|nr:hypothetical protein FB451DRAFT_1376746 [Mycena latifolia]
MLLCCTRASPSPSLLFSLRRATLTAGLMSEASAMDAQMLNEWLGTIVRAKESAPPPSPPPFFHSQLHFHAAAAHEPPPTCPARESLRLKPRASTASASEWFGESASESEVEMEDWAASAVGVDAGQDPAAAVLLTSPTPEVDAKTKALSIPSSWSDTWPAYVNFMSIPPAASLPRACHVTGNRRSTARIPHLPESHSRVSRCNTVRLPRLRGLTATAYSVVLDGRTDSWSKFLPFDSDSPQAPESGGFRHGDGACGSISEVRPIFQLPHVAEG